MASKRLLFKIEIFESVATDTISSLKDGLINIYGDKNKTTVENAIKGIINTVTNLINKGKDVKRNSGPYNVKYNIGEMGEIELSYVFINGIDMFEFTIRAYQYLFSEEKEYVTKPIRVKAYITNVETTIDTHHGKTKVASGNYIATFEDGSIGIFTPEDFHVRFEESKVDSKVEGANKEDDDDIFHSRKDGYTFTVSAINKVNRYLKNWGFYCTHNILPGKLIYAIASIPEVTNTLRDNTNDVISQTNSIIVSELDCKSRVEEYLQSISNAKKVLGENVSYPMPEIEEGDSLL